MAEEWDNEKNDARPEEYIPGNHKKVWWKCRDCGFSWSAQIKERTWGKTGCVRCAFYHKSSIPEQILFFYVKKCFPEAINSYQPDYLAPMEIDIFIPELNLGIEYDGKGWHNDVKRDLNKSERLHAAGVRLVRVRDKGLSEMDNDDHIIWADPFAGELNRFEPVLKELFEYLKSEHPEIMAPDINLTRDYAEIRTALSKKALEGSIAERFPELLIEWNYEKNGTLSPEMIKAGSHTEVWWKCSKCGREWTQSAKTKAITGLYCGHCNKSEANRQRTIAAIKSGKRKSVTDYELLKREWDYEKNGIDPSQVSYGSDKKYWWLCAECGYSFQMIVKNRTMQGQGCPGCGRKKSAKTRSKSGKGYER